MDYQSNSKKNREKAEKSEPQEDKKIVKIITGEVIQKPKGIRYKMKEVFLGGNFTTAMQYVTADVLLPALRNLILDMVSKGTERLIFGDSYYRRSGYDPRPRISYQNYGNPIYRDPRLVSDIRANLPDQRRPLRQNRRDVNDIILSSREEAELVVERLIDVIDRYQVVSLQDLHELLGLPSSHVDQKWGWTYLNNVQIRQVRDGHLIELPPLEEI